MLLNLAFITIFCYINYKILLCLESQLDGSSKFVNTSSSAYCQSKLINCLFHYKNGVPSDLYCYTHLCNLSNTIVEAFSKYSIQRSHKYHFSIQHSHNYHFSMGCSHNYHFSIQPLQHSTSSKMSWIANMI